MRRLLTIVAFALQHTALVVSTSPAPLLGPGYPAPTDLTSNSSLIPAAWSNFTSTIDSFMRKNQTIEGLVSDLGSYSLSVGAFSIHDAHAVGPLQHHHTGPDVDVKVNSDSVYRVASISKVFTVYLALIEIGSTYWDRPITDFVPFLANFAKNHAVPNPIHVVDWESVTIGTLAGQIAGIPRDSAFFNSDLLIKLQGTGEDPTALGLPPVNPDSVDPCLGYMNETVLDCPDDVYLQALTQRAPVFSPWTTPIYTNGGFDLIALAVENITGKKIEALYQKDMWNPLGMTCTSANSPISYTNAVVPGGNSSVAGLGFAYENINAAASGGIYSSTTDLGKFGLSILNSTLLSPLETRQWLKPITHINSLRGSIGRPWEIFRMTQPVTGRTTDLYAKQGDSTGYSSYLILSPDHGVGFSILIAGNASTTIANTVVADTLTSILIPALEAQAAAETTRNFAGHYASSDPSLNSSLTLAVNATYGPGLVVTSWISNGTDMLSTVLPTLLGDELSLFPTDLRTMPSPEKVGTWAFRGTFGNSKHKRGDGKGEGLFTSHVTTELVWATVDASSYGGVGLDLFGFDVDEEGKAVAVSPAVTRAVYKKVG